MIPETSAPTTPAISQLLLDKIEQRQQLVSAHELLEREHGQRVQEFQRQVAQNAALFQNLSGAIDVLEKLQAPPEPD